MASTKKNGTALLVFADGTAIGASTSASLSVDSDSIDVTTKDSAGWAEILPGLRSWSVDIEALLTYDESPKRPYDFLYAAFVNRTAITVKFSTELVGDDRMTGTAYVTSAPIEAPMEDKITYSVTLEGSGALTLQTVT